MRFSRRSPDCRWAAGPKLDPDIPGVASLTRELEGLGVERGSVSMVHASLRRVGLIEGGGDALLDTVTLTHWAENLADLLAKRRVKLRYVRADSDEQWIESQSLRKTAGVGLPGPFCSWYVDGAIGRTLQIGSTPYVSR